MMKRICVIIMLLLVTTIVYASEPVVFFTDLISGPESGGKDNNGVFLTIYGKEFGSSQGTVTVGGGEVCDYISWSESASWSDGRDGMDIIEVQLGSAVSTGDVVVTTAEGASNGIAFIVRSGNIYFVDINSPNDPGLGTYSNAWRSPASYYDNMQPGDTCYFREGTYSGVYGRIRDNFWRYNMYIAKSGTPGNPIAFVGYPGETATFYADSGADPTSCFLGHYNENSGLETSHIVVAKFNLIARKGCIGARGDWRVIGNYCEGIRSEGYAIIGSERDYAKVLGNEITGGGSGNSLDHAIYNHRGLEIELAWNYIHDNYFGNGYMISNHTDNAQALGRVWIDHHIHANIIDVTTYPSRAIAIGECAAGSSFYIYNNLIIGGAVGISPSIQINSSEVHLWNNTIYDTGGVAGSYGAPIVVYQANVNYLPGPVSIVNNVICTKNSVYYIGVKTGSGIVMEVDSNCYYGIGNYGGGDDANMVNANPEFVNPPYDLRLENTSACIDKGSSYVYDIIKRDIDGIGRPQGLLYDIGAYEYVSGEMPNKPPVIESMTAEPLSGEVPLSVSYTLVVIDPEGDEVTIIWTFGDGYASSEQNPIHVYNTADIYTASVVVRDEHGATATQSIVITVTEPANRPPVITSITVNPTAGVAPLLVSYAVTAEDPDGNISYAWNFGDGNISSEQNPSHTYAQAGIYTVSIVVTDNDGATASDTVIVTVTDAQPPTGNITLVIRQSNKRTKYNGLTTEQALQIVEEAMVAGSYTAISIKK